MDLKWIRADWDLWSGGWKARSSLMLFRWIGKTALVEFSGFTLNRFKMEATYLKGWGEARLVLVGEKPFKEKWRLHSKDLGGGEVHAWVCVGSSYEIATWERCWWNHALQPNIFLAFSPPKCHLPPLYAKQIPLRGVCFFTLMEHDVCKPGKVFQNDYCFVCSMRNIDLCSDYSSLFLLQGTQVSTTSAQAVTGITCVGLAV